MTNADDVFAELEQVKRCLRKGDEAGALESIAQAQKLWQAEIDFWTNELHRAQQGWGPCAVCGKDTLFDICPRCSDTELSRSEKARAGDSTRLQ